MFAFQFDELNRQGELRKDSQTLDSFIEDPNSLFLPIYKQYLAADSAGLVWLNHTELLKQVGVPSQIHYIYLGVIKKQHYFAYRFSNSEQLKSLADSSDNLRNLLPLLTVQDAYLANVAVGLNQWHNSHQFCGVCGSATYAKESGFVRQCTNENCNKEHFPRTDPAIIVAITHTDPNGTEKILLGRQASWPEKRFSVIAGFVEPGESLEQSVKREAMEEVGIDVEHIEYQASQPWPFPQSIMLGFKAKALSTNIQLKDKELESANWFNKEEIKKLVEEGELLLPFPYSISRHLIEDWLSS